jgi:hypothetical protein
MPYEVVNLLNAYLQSCHILLITCDTHNAIS